MSKLLSERIKDLRLRSDAPYPSEVFDAHDLILQWRRSQRLHLVADHQGADLDLEDGEIEQ